MLSQEQFKTLSDFLLDSSKILFGSLVVGAFLPGTTGPVSWVTFVIGIFLTISFLIVAIILSKPLKNKLSKN